MGVSAIGVGRVWVPSASAVASGGGASGAGDGLAGLAGRLGLDSGVLARFVADGGRLSFATVSTGADSGLIASAAAALGNARMPMTDDGFPDFDAVLAAGGTVTGVLAPDGSPMTQVASNLGTAVAYAAIVDLGDGSPPFLVKGGDAIAATPGDAGDREELLGQLASLLDQAPDDLEQAQLWAHLNTWPTQRRDDPPSTTRRIDAWT